MKPKEIVVLGAGFGGLTFCQKFDSEQARVTLIDRQNHHLFQPLLYQVATGGLSAPDIAQPIRAILTDKPRLTVLLDEVQEIDLAAKKIVHDRGALTYDYLVLALGGVTSYFGHNDWEQFAPGLKSLDDALRIRRDVLLAYERAEITEDLAEQKKLMTQVVIGGGPTGVEMAGALAELARFVLNGDFNRIDPSKARVILIEASPRVLSHLPPDLSESAQKQLLSLGVEVHSGVKVTAIREGVVEIGDEVIEAANIIWAAGVGGNPLTHQLGVELDRAGRIKVAPDCSLPGHPEVFAIGDIASLVDKNGHVVPGVSPAAMQMAQHVAQIIHQEITLRDSLLTDRAAFAYWDKGTMATIGRSRAVAMVGQMKFTGFIAWLAWLGIHLLFLVGFRNKLTVLLQWTYSYFTYKRGARIITGLSRKG
jgi:NADH dehydrogenase